MRLVILFSLSYSLISFSYSPFCFFPFPPVVVHHLHPNPLAAALPQSQHSSPQSAPSASPHTPRGYGRRHCGRIFYRRTTWGVAPLKEMVVDLGDAARAGSALAAHIGLEVGHTRLFRRGRGSFLTQLRSVLLRRCFADAAVNVGGGCEAHMIRTLMLRTIKVQDSPTI